MQLYFGNLENLPELLYQPFDLVESFLELMFEEARFPPTFVQLTT